MLYFFIVHVPISVCSFSEVLGFAFCGGESGGLEREMPVPVEGAGRGHFSFSLAVQASACGGSHHDEQVERASPSFLEGRWCCGGWSRQSLSGESNREVRPGDTVGSLLHLLRPCQPRLGYWIWWTWATSTRGLELRWWDTAGGGRSPILRQHHVQYMSGRNMSASLDCHMQTKIIQNQQQKAQWTWVDVMCCKGMSSRGAVMLVERSRSRFSRGTDKRDSDEIRVERLPGRSANKATM